MLKLGRRSVLRPERLAAWRSTRRIRGLSGSPFGRARSSSSSGLGASCCRRSSSPAFSFASPGPACGLTAPHWARGLGVLALALGLVIALLPLRTFRFPSRKEALGPDRPRIRPCVASRGGDRRPACQWDEGSGNPRPVEPASPRAEQAVALLRTGGPSPRTVDLDHLCLAGHCPRRADRDRLCRWPRKICARRGGFRLALRWFAWQWLEGGRLDRSSRLHRKAAARVEPWRKPEASPVQQNPQQIEAPSGSIVVIHAPAGNLDIEHQRRAHRGHEGQTSFPARRARPRPRRRQTLQGSRAAKTKSGWCCAATQRSTLAASAGRSPRSIFMRSWTSRRRLR